MKPSRRKSSSARVGKSRSTGSAGLVPTGPTGGAPCGGHGAPDGGREMSIRTVTTSNGFGPNPCVRGARCSQRE